MKTEKTVVDSKYKSAFTKMATKQNIHLIADNLHSTIIITLIRDYVAQLCYSDNTKMNVKQSAVLVEI